MTVCASGWLANLVGWFGFWGFDLLALGVLMRLVPAFVLSVSLIAGVALVSPVFAQTPPPPPAPPTAKPAAALNLPTAAPAGAPADRPAPAPLTDDAPPAAPAPAPAPTPAVTTPAPPAAPAVPVVSRPATPAVGTAPTGQAEPSKGGALLNRLLNEQGGAAPVDPAAQAAAAPPASQEKPVNKNDKRKGKVTAAPLPAADAASSGNGAAAAPTNTAAPAPTPAVVAKPAEPKAPAKPEVKTPVAAAAPVAEKPAETVPAEPAPPKKKKKYRHTARKKTATDAAAATTPQPPQPMVLTEPKLLLTMTFPDSAAGLGAEDLKKLAQAIRGYDPVRINFMINSYGRTTTNFPSDAKREALTRALAVRRELLALGFSGQQIGMQTLMASAADKSQHRVELVATPR